MIQEPQKISDSGQSPSMSLFEHLAELRTRLVRSLAVFLFFFALSYAFRIEILDAFRYPVVEPLEKYRIASIQKKAEEKAKNPVLSSNYTCRCEEEPRIKDTSADTAPEKLELNCHCTKGEEVVASEVGGSSTLVFLGLTELFFTQIKAAFFFAFFLAFPALMIETWGFVGPALYRKEKKVFWFFAFSSYLCFIGGALFGYFVVFPYGFDFFLSLSQPGEIMPNLAIGEYFSFSLKLLFAFGVVFELPILTLILTRLRILTARWMVVNAKYIVLLIFIVSAILTPPDPFTMLLMSIPLLVLYAISIIVCKLAEPKD